jgi:predicted nuclease of predicted toxin-antitoxin system
MKLLLDEQLPTKLKYRFSELGHETFTVRDMNWLGKKNGELLNLISKENFDVFVTNDKNLHFQQNTTNYNFSILNVNTKTNRYEDVMAVFDKIEVKLEEIQQIYANRKGKVNNYFIISIGEEFKIN